MKDRFQQEIGTENLQEIQWSEIDWRKVHEQVTKLRQRIYKATKNGEWNKVRSLTKLMLRSQSNLMHSIRKVTQINQGKRTAGIDGEKVTDNDGRKRLVHEMSKYRPWNVKPVKRIYIPKANGKQRPLGIPTVKDRVMQAIVVNALEPQQEAVFEPNSFGFRCGRSCHDAIEQLWYRLNNHSNDEWVLDADIKGAFDNINHEFILEKVKHFPARELIKQWLKAGYVEREVFCKVDSGTPQGGVISPLLANIALDGLEEHLSTYTTVREYQYKDKKGKIKISKRKFPKYSIVRYADDFVITSQTKEDIEQIVPVIKDWLKQRGLELNEEKTRIVKVEKGFDFLGFNIRTYKGKCLIKPQKEKVIEKRKEIKKLLKRFVNAEAVTIIKLLNPILRGWGNYYRHSVAKEIFASFDHEIVQLLLLWARRKHGKQKSQWIRRKYFGKVGGDKWVFRAKTENKNGEVHFINIVQLAKIPITRHIKVKLDASPDNRELRDYWENRRTKYGRTRFEKGSKLYKVAENQKWKCPVCKEHLLNGELWDTHHIITVKDGGRNDENNLIHLHKSCHKNLHGKLSKEVRAV